MIDLIQHNFVHVQKFSYNFAENDDKNTI